MASRSRVNGPVTAALENFAAALREAGIDPTLVAVSIPISEWRTLARVLEREKGEPVPADIGQIEVGGVKYLVRFRP